MCHEALQPGLRWLGRSRGSNAEAERRLHDEEREHYGGNAVEQRRQQSWSRKPVTRCKNDEHKREHDANGVVGSPANLALKAFLWRSVDTRMPKSAPRHVAKP